MRYCSHMLLSHKVASLLFVEFLQELQTHVGHSVTEPGSSCSPLESQFLRQVLVGKETLLCFGGRQPEERVDSCPRTNARLLFGGQGLLRAVSGLYRRRAGLEQHGQL